MAKRRRIVIVGFLVLATVLTAVIFLSRQGPRYGDTISFLKGRKSTRDKQVMSLYNWTRASYKVKPKPLLWVTDTYIFDEPFESLQKKAKLELKPRSFSASAYPQKDTRYQSYSLRDTKTGSTFTVTLNKESKTRTTVAITEWREASWFDETMDKVAGFFRPKDPEVTIRY